MNPGRILHSQFRKISEQKLEQILKRILFDHEKFCNQECDDVVITRAEKRERWNDNRTEKKIAPSRDLNHAPPAIRADALAN